MVTFARATSQEGKNNCPPLTYKKTSHMKISYKKFEEDLHKNVVNIQDFFSPGQFANIIRFFGINYENRVSESNRNVYHRYTK